MAEKIVKDSQGLAKDLVNDTISRRAAVDMILGQPIELHYPSWYAEQIKALPPAQLKSYREGYQAGFNEGYQAGFKDAQLEQPWIPCSERLPEDEQPILFSTTTGRVHQGRFHRDNSVNRWYSSLDKMRAYNNVVNAWMPLPEPYKEDDHG